MRIRPSCRAHREFAAPLAFTIVTCAGLIGAGCGGESPPFVDPHPLSDGGVPDRIVLEAGPTDSREGGLGGAAGDAGGAGGGAGMTTMDAALSDDGRVDGVSGDLSADVAIADAALVSTTVSVDVTDPGENALQVASRRFAPLVRVVVTTDPAQSDDIKDVNVDLWSTGSAAAKISTTKLSQLSKTGGAGGTAGTGTNGSGSGGGAGGAGTTGSGGPTPNDGGTIMTGTQTAQTQTTYTFGDTPVDLSALVTDNYEFRFVATTLAGVAGTLSRHVRVDAGPVIRIVSPTVDQAARGSILVSVQVTDPFSTTPPTVTVNVASIPITPLTVTGNLYQATVAETIAMPPLSGEQLLDVGAVNAAGVAARHAVVRFVFDDVGPLITNGKPSTGSLIGGIVKLEADVSDPAGVDINSVVAVVAHGGTSLEVKLDQDANDHKHFAHLFDSRRLSNTVLYPTLSFRASDLPGNQSNIGYPVAVDNTPPLADLDPPADLRVRNTVNGVTRCSWGFDPLGTDAVNDGDRVLQLFDVRARVEDDGNTPAAGGADITPLAGLDPAHVELLVLDDTNRALVVDTDGDGVCDAVNPKLVPTTTPMSSLDALLVNLVPVTPTGSADFTADPSIPSGGYADCGPGNEILKPLGLCKTSDLTTAIPQHDAVSPAVWTIPRVVPSTLQCVGNQLDVLGNHLNDGPACLAVHAVDQLGNSQVSRVLHVCIDHDGDGAECPFAAIASVEGGAPVRVTTAAPHGLASGASALVGGVPTLFDANGLWTITVLGATSFSLDGSSTPSMTVSGGAFMRWTAASDCTGRQTAINPPVINDAAPCRPWRSYHRGEHLGID